MKHKRDSNQRKHDKRRQKTDTTTQPELPAARAVFNTTELLEAILLHFPIKSLVRALTVSKYCREVILGSLELRRVLFLDPSPATEFIELHDRQLFDFTVTRVQMRSTPSQIGRIVITAHPALMLTKSIHDLSIHGQPRKDLYPSPTHVISEGTMQKMSPSTLPFQPSPPRVEISYRGHFFVLESQGGLTFGALAEGLQNLRRQCQNDVDKLVKLPCTYSHRWKYAQAMRVLGGPGRRHDSVSRSEPDISIKAESAICDDSGCVRTARNGNGFADWWHWN